MSVKSAVELMRQIPLFADVDEPHLQTLIFSSEEQVYPARATVYEAGQPATSALLIKAGEAVVHDGSTDSVIALAGPGAFLGELSMVARLPRAHTIRVRSELTVMEIEHSLFVRLCAEFPEVGIRVLNILNQNLDSRSRELDDVKSLFEPTATGPADDSGSD